MKINLAMKEEFEPVQAEVLSEFEMFGFRFCVTHPYFTGGFAKCFYTVTEYSTGLKVGNIYSDKYEVEDSVKLLLSRTGEEVVKQKVDQARRKFGIINN
jgi:hypothetical protein